MSQSSVQAEDHEDLAANRHLVSCLKFEDLNSVEIQKTLQSFHVYLLIFACLQSLLNIFIVQSNTEISKVIKYPPSHPQPTAAGPR